MHNFFLFSLQAELEACKMSKEEELCKKLRRDLEELQEEYYRKQMKLQVQRQSRVQKSSSAFITRKNQRNKPATSPESTVDVPKIFEIDSQSDSESEIWNSVDHMNFPVIEDDKQYGSDVNEEMELYNKYEGNMQIFTLFLYDEIILSGFR